MSVGVQIFALLAAYRWAKRVMNNNNVYKVATMRKDSSIIVPLDESLSEINLDNAFPP